VATADAFWVRERVRRPADLQPSLFELVVILRTAKAIAFPLRADEVIEE
jgi:hypothetical protein